MPFYTKFLEYSKVDTLYGHNNIDIENHTWVPISMGIDWTKEEGIYWLQSYQEELLLIKLDSECIINLKKQATNLTRTNNDVLSILQTVNDLVNDLTAMPGMTRQQVEQTLDDRLKAYLKQQRENPQIFPSVIETHRKNVAPVITMDELIKEKLLVCSHKGILVACILGHLAKQQILPPGIVHAYRSELIIQGQKQASGHEWATYWETGSGRLWMSDPRWNVIHKLPRESKAAEGAYGRLTIRHMIGRHVEQDILKAFFSQMDKQRSILKHFRNIEIIELYVECPVLNKYQIRADLDKNSQHYLAFCDTLDKFAIPYHLVEGLESVMMIQANPQTMLGLNYPAFFKYYTERLAFRNLDMLSQHLWDKIQIVKESLVTIETLDETFAVEAPKYEVQVFAKRSSRSLPEPKPCSTQLKP